MATDAKPWLVTFDEATHTYSLNGRPIALSVTGVLGLTGFSDFSRIPPDVLERKRRLGRRVHKATELIDTVGLDWESVKFDDMGYIDAYQRFTEALKPEWVTIEHRGVMEVNGMLCGFMHDRAGWIHGDAYMVELKCAYAPEDWWKYQLAGYVIGAEKLPGQKAPYKRLAVQLKPDGTYKLFPYDKNYAHDLSVFRSALHLASVHVAEGRGKVAA